MPLIKTGEAEILDVIPEPQRDDAEVRRTMAQASEEMTKNSNQVKTERR